ncbi:replication protein E1 [Human papillomavirus 29]|uniref:Replication protein E1 n=1 Tax=Human papillomavirus 29 TaxID=37112 RepID=VE1_HPV29|nr:RecName: Full=Replication protein E1; AltName: Full=ATP-dependent helicase E1 [Human papillomavirus 29]AAA79431.1 replication protein E1 [Human papillomavirus 29]
MADNSGTEGEEEDCSEAERAGGWFMVEAIVDRRTGDTISSDEDEEDEGEDMVDFIDDRPIGDGQEVAQELLLQQAAADDDEAVHTVKRKFAPSPYFSPVCVPSIEHELSPRLDAIKLGRQSSKAKRRLFQLPDSGYGQTQVDTDTGPSQVQDGCETGDQNGRQQYKEGSGTKDGENGSQEEERAGGDGEESQPLSTETEKGACGVLSILKASNQKATLLGKFKEQFGLGYNELVRHFKSSRTACVDWVVCVFGVYCTVAEGIKQLIQPLCEYAHIQVLPCQWGMTVLMLVRYKRAKNRETVAKGLSTLLNVPESHMLIEPPKLRSSPAALYWYKTSMSNISDVYGETPEWIVRQTMVGHALQEVQFSLSEMVQWAYDHDITDEGTLAYEYALIADVDSNAAAFLASNCQAKYVKDACTMCRHYKRGEQARMSMSEWIRFRSNKVQGEGDWKPIVHFLRYQNVEFIPFLCAFKLFLQGIPKKSCLVFYGPADTGKSYFCMSLLKFMGGVVISYANSHSHFWLQPLSEAKMGLLDDATSQCWSYVDTYLRNALDGNVMCIDRKHRSLLQLKCPPLLITTNVNPLEDDRWKYLRSRLQVFTFSNPCPLTSKGEPVYTLNDQNWKSFFQRLWARLSLTDPDDEEENGEPSEPFRCVPGQNTRTV